MYSAVIIQAPSQLAAMMAVTAVPIQALTQALIQVIPLMMMET